MKLRCNARHNITPLLYDKEGFKNLLPIMLKHQVQPMLCMDKRHFAVRVFLLSFHPVPLGKPEGIALIDLDRSDFFNLHLKLHFCKKSY